MSSALDAFLGEHPLTDSVDLLLPDLSGILRGKRLSPSALRDALAGQAFFSTTLYALDGTGANVDASGIVWEEGDADRPLRLDPGTLCPVPWRPGGAQILGGLADHDAHAVIDEEPAADLGTRVNLDPGHEAAYLRDEPRRDEPAATPQGVGQAMEHQRMDAGIAQHDLETRPRRRIALENRLDILAQTLEHQP